MSSKNTVREFGYGIHDFELHWVKRDGTYWDICCIYRGNYYLGTRARRIFAPFSYKTIKQAKDACIKYVESGCRFWTDMQGNTATWLNEEH